MFNWKKRDKTNDDLPSRNLEPGRYENRPLLMILENYVLDCIGELPAERQQGTTSVVQQVFGGGEDWKKTMREVLHLGDSVDEHLRQMWEQNKIAAQVAGEELHPVQYAKMIVDSNFAHLID